MFMEKYKILFVCLGNICRSPSAEGLFRALVEKRGVADRFVIDSAGIGGWHTGERADARMRKHALQRGYDLTSRARKVYPEADFTDFDLIIGMDDENIRDLKALAKNEKELAKIHKMTEYNRRMQGYKIIPDPYFGGDEGFELVLDLLEDATEGLLESLLPELQ